MEEVSVNQIASSEEYSLLYGQAFAEKEEAFRGDSRELLINGYTREISLYSVDRNTFNYHFSQWRRIFLMKSGMELQLHMGLDQEPDLELAKAGLTDAVENAENGRRRRKHSTSGGPPTSLTSCHRYTLRPPWFSCPAGREKRPLLQI